MSKALAIGTLRALVSVRTWAVGTIVGFALGALASLVVPGLSAAIPLVLGILLAALARSLSDVGREEQRRLNAGDTGTIRRLEQMLGAVPADGRRRGELELLLAEALVARFERRSDPQDLARAVALSNRSAAGVGAETAESVAVLSRALLRRFQYAGDPGDIDDAVSLGARAVEMLPARSPVQSVALEQQAQALLTRYAATGVVGDRDEAERICRSLLGGARRGSVLGMLGSIQQQKALAGDFAAQDEGVQMAERSLELAPVDADPTLHADAVIGLCVALVNRFALTREPADLQRVIAEADATLRRPAVSPTVRLDLHLVLAQAWLFAYLSSREPDALERAITSVEAAVGQSRPHDPNRAGMLSVLGTALGEKLDRVDGDSPLVDRQLKVFAEAAALAGPETPFGAGVQKGWGLAYRDRWMRRGSEEDYGSAVEHLQLALDASHLPQERAQIRDILASMLTRRHSMGGPVDLLADAVAHWESALDELRQDYVDAPTRYRIVERIEWPRVGANVVEACVKLARERPAQAPGLHVRAMLAAESNKARLLAQALSRHRLVTPPGVSEDDISRERALVGRLQRVDQGELATTLPGARVDTPGAMPSRERQQLVDELHARWRTIAAAGEGGAEYVRVRRGVAPTWEDIESLTGDDTALISIFVAGESSFAFVLRTGWSTPIVEEIRSARWEPAVAALTDEIHSYAGARRHRGRWYEPLRDLLESLGPHVSGARRRRRPPDQSSHLLPWSLAASMGSWTDGSGEPITVVTVPALDVLAQIRRRSPRLEPGDALVIASNPRGDLKYAVDEATAVAELLHTAPLIGPRATKDAVRARLPGADYVHFAAHASFDPESPLDSGILVDDGVLTAREAMESELDARLVVLSACETGMSARLAGDELAGLAYAFLVAGARSLVVSLWAVDDESSAALMRRLYALRAAHDTATALKLAANDTRSAAAWAHPFFWAAFTFTGDWK